MGQLTGATPTYIFPVVPTANNSVYTCQLMSMSFLPLYTGPKGATPEIDYGLSLANKPVFSGGNKTVTIPMKTNFRWSDGQPVDANDLIFQIDLIKQAVAESAANWAPYTPGLIPDSIASVTASGKYTVVMRLKRAFNPGYFFNDQLSTLVPIPSTAWNVASAAGRHLDYTVPANAKKIYDYLSKMGGRWRRLPATRHGRSSTVRSYSEASAPLTAPTPSWRTRCTAAPKPMISQRRRRDVPSDWCQTARSSVCCEAF